MLRRHPSTQRRVPTGPDDVERLTADIVELARRHGRLGYRNIAEMLRSTAGWIVNDKRVERIWRREGLKVPAKQSKQGRIWLADGSCIRLRAERPNHVWSYDFVEDRTHEGRKLLIFATLLVLVLTHTPPARLGRRLATIAGGTLLLYTLTPLCVLLIRPLEDRFPSIGLEQLREPKGIITLGGVLNPELTRARGPIALSDSGARLTEALAIANRFPHAQLVFAGRSEGEVARRFAAELGLPPERLTIEPLSRNTFENAQFAHALVEPKPGQRWILVTSASHMPRAVGSFRKAGFDVTPYPVDYFTLADSRDYWNYTFAPLSALSRSTSRLRSGLGSSYIGRPERPTNFYPLAKGSRILILATKVCQDEDAQAGVRKVRWIKARRGVGGVHLPAYDWRPWPPALMRSADQVYFPLPGSTRGNRTGASLSNSLPSLSSRIFRYT